MTFVEGDERCPGAWLSSKGPVFANVGGSPQMTFFSQRALARVRRDKIERDGLLPMDGGRRGLGAGHVRVPANGDGGGGGERPVYTA
jgi:hypothetical protein